MRFRLRLMISISLLIALAFGAGGSLLVSASFQTALHEEQTLALHSYETIRSTLYLLNSLGEKTDYENMADALKQMEKQGVARWQALSLQSEERLIYQSGDSALFSATLPVPKADQCAYTILTEKDKSSLQILSTISTEDQPLLLRARFDLTSAYEARKTQQRLYLFIYIAVVLLGILVAAAISSALTKRLRKLTGAVRQIAGGDLSKRSNSTANDEFGQLSRDFDTMADKLEENISRLKADVERQEAFMGAFAHELKTPMTSIIGYADLLRQDGLEESDKIAAANYIFFEGQRLEKLSFKLLDLLLMEKETLTLKEVGFSALLTEVEQVLSPVMREKSIRFVCRKERGRVILEPDLVKSLLYNLVDNAAKAIEENGVIEIRGRLIAGGCRIQITDNGRGMQASELSKITEAFYRVDKSRSRRQGGAGLGLALCKKIVELHHGSMKFTSAPGHGTCVTVELYGSRRDLHEKR